MHGTGFRADRPLEDGMRLGRIDRQQPRANRGLLGLRLIALKQWLH